LGGDGKGEGMERKEGRTIGMGENNVNATGRGGRPTERQKSNGRAEERRGWKETRASDEI